MRILSKKYIKLISWHMPAIFLLQTIAWSAPATNYELRNMNYETKPSIFIPEQYGKIEKQIRNSSRWNRNEIRNSPKLPQVILIKDAHCHYEAQRNIAKILNILIKDYKVDLIGVEGASGKVDPSIIAGSPDEKRRKEVADKYLKKGYLTASEVLAMEEGKDYGFSIWGVEDLKLYLNDLKVFRDVYSGSEVAERFIDIGKGLILSLKNKLYVQDVLDFDKKVKEYKDNKLSLTELIKYLYTIDSQRFVKYTNLRLVLKVLSLERAIDFKKVETERTELIKEIEKKLPKEELEMLVKKSLEYRLGKISSLDYYVYLEQFIKSYDLRLITYNLQRYIRNIKIHSKIDENSLFKEIDTLIEDTYKDCIKDEVAWKLHEVDEYICLLNKLLTLEITRGELTRYREKGTRISSIVDFLKIQGNIHNITIPNEFTGEDFIRQVEDFYKQPEEFYRYAIERDDAIIENLIIKMRDTGKDKAVLIVGGFHADGVEKLLREKNIQVITISPSITKEDTNAKKLYLSRMMDERIQPDRMLREFGVSNLSAPVMTGWQEQFGPVIKLIKKEQIVEKLESALAKATTPSEFREQARLVLTTEEIRIIEETAKNNQNTVLWEILDLLKTQGIHNAPSRPVGETPTTEREKPKEPTDSVKERIRGIIDDILDIVRKPPANGIEFTQDELHGKMVSINGLTNLAYDSGDENAIRALFEIMPGMVDIYLQSANAKKEPALHTILDTLLDIFDEFNTEIKKVINEKGDENVKNMLNEALVKIRSKIETLISSSQTGKAKNKNMQEGRSEGLEVEGFQKLLKVPVDKKHVIIGDIHGELDGLKQDLRDAGLIDANDNWIGGETVLVQMGDMIDRGSKSIKAVEFLNNLEKQGAKVIRLLGDHELIFIRGMLGDDNSLTDWLGNGGFTVLDEIKIGISYDKFKTTVLKYYKDLREIDKLKAEINVKSGDLKEQFDKGKMKLAEIEMERKKIESISENAEREFTQYTDSGEFKEVMKAIAENEMLKKLFDYFVDAINNDKIKAAYAQGGLLFTHAGCLPHISEGRLVDDVAKDLNERLINAVSNAVSNTVSDNNFSDPIFQIGESRRGGKGVLPGIFWADFIENIQKAEEELDFDQVVAHTRDGSRVRVSQKGRVVNVDVGHYSGFGGNRGYAVMEGDSIKAYELVPDRTCIIIENLNRLIAKIEPGSVKPSIVTQKALDKGVLSKITPILVLALFLSAMSFALVSDTKQVTHDAVHIESPVTISTDDILDVINDYSRGIIDNNAKVKLDILEQRKYEFKDTGEIIDVVIVEIEGPVEATAVAFYNPERNKVVVIKNEICSFVNRFIMPVISGEKTKVEIWGRWRDIAPESLDEMQGILARLILNIPDISHDNREGIIEEHLEAIINHELRHVYTTARPEDFVKAIGEIKKKLLSLESSEGAPIYIKEPLEKFALNIAEELDARLYELAELESPLERLLWMLDFKEVPDSGSYDATHISIAIILDELYRTDLFSGIGPKNIDELRNYIKSLLEGAVEGKIRDAAKRIRREYMLPEYRLPARAPVDISLIEGEMLRLKELMPNYPKTRMLIENLVSGGISFGIIYLILAYFSFGIPAAGIMAVLGVPLISIIFSVLHFEFGKKELWVRFREGIKLFRLFFLLPVIIGITPFVGIITLIILITSIAILILADSFILHLRWNKKAELTKETIIGLLIDPTISGRRQGMVWEKIGKGKRVSVYGVDTHGHARGYLHGYDFVVKVPHKDKGFEEDFSEEEGSLYSLFRDNLGGIAPPMTILETSGDNFKFRLDARESPAPHCIIVQKKLLPITEVKRGTKRKYYTKAAKKAIEIMERGYFHEDILDENNWMFDPETGEVYLVDIMDLREIKKSDIKTIKRYRRYIYSKNPEEENIHIFMEAFFNQLKSKWGGLENLLKVKKTKGYPVPDYLIRKPVAKETACEQYDAMALLLKRARGEIGTREYYYKLQETVDPSAKVITDLGERNGRKAINKMMELGEEFIPLLVEPGISTRTGKFVEFARGIVGQHRENREVIDINIVRKIRDQFEGYLGKMAIYRALWLTKEKMEAMRANGIRPLPIDETLSLNVTGQEINDFKIGRNNDTQLLKALKRDSRKKGKVSEVFSRIRSFYKYGVRSDIVLRRKHLAEAESFVNSVTQIEQVAKDVAMSMDWGIRGEGNKPYLFKIEIPAIYLIQWDEDYFPIRTNQEIQELIEDNGYNNIPEIVLIASNGERYSFSDSQFESFVEISIEGGKNGWIKDVIPLEITSDTYEIRYTDSEFEDKLTSLQLTEEAIEIIIQILNEFPFNPEKLMEELKKIPFLGELFGLPAGVPQGYSIETHTIMAMNQFEKYFNNTQLPRNMDRSLFRLILALHDIGKGWAIKQFHNKKMQHSYTVQIMAAILEKLKFGENEIKLATALVNGDPIGSYFKENGKKGKLESFIQEFERMQKSSSMSAFDFFNMLIIYYQVDTASYTKDAGFKRKILDSLFKFDKNTNRFAFDNEAGRMRFSEKYAQLLEILEKRIKGYGRENVNKQIQTAPSPAIEERLFDRFNGDRGWISKPEYLQWLNNIRNFIKSKIGPQEQIIVYYYGLGGGRSPHASGVERIDILSPLISTDFDTMLGMDRGSPYFFGFRRKVIEELLVLGLSEESNIKFEEESSDTFIVRFNYKGKSRKVKVTYGKDAEKECPEEIEKGQKYNVLYSRGLVLFPSIKRKIKKKLLNNLITGKGMIILESPPDAEDTIEGFTRVDLGDTSWAGNVRRLDVFFKETAAPKPVKYKKGGKAGYNDTDSNPQIMKALEFGDFTCVQYDGNSVNVTPLDFREKDGTITPLKGNKSDEVDLELLKEIMDILSQEDKELLRNIKVVLIPGLSAHYSRTKYNQVYLNLDLLKSDRPENIEDIKWQLHHELQEKKMVREAIDDNSKRPIPEVIKETAQKAHRDLILEELQERFGINLTQDEIDSPERLDAKVAQEARDLLRVLKLDGEITQDELDIVVDKATMATDIFNRYRELGDFSKRFDLIQEIVAMQWAREALGKNNVPRFVNKLIKALGGDEKIVEALVMDLYNYDGYDDYFVLMLDGIRNMFSVEKRSGADKYLKMLDEYKYRITQIKGKFNVKDARFISSGDKIYNVLMDYLKKKGDKEMLGEVAEIVARYLAYEGNEGENENEILDLFTDVRIRHLVKDGIEKLISRKGLLLEEKPDSAVYEKLANLPEDRISRAKEGYKLAAELLDKGIGAELQWQPGIRLEVETKLFVDKVADRYIISPVGEMILWLLEKAKDNLEILYETEEEKALVVNWLAGHGIKEAVFTKNLGELKDGEIAVSMLTDKTAEAYEKDRKLKNRRVIKGRKPDDRGMNGENDLMLMSRIAGILGSQQVLTKKYLKKQFGKLYEAYYKGSLDNREIDKLVKQVTEAIEKGITIIIELPPIAPFVKAYYNTLKIREGIVASAA